MRSLEAKPHTSVRRINEAQSHGEVCGVGRRPQQQQLVKEEEEAEERGIPLHIAKCSQTGGGGGGETTWPQRPSVVRSLDHPAGLAVALASCQPTEQPSERVVWFGGAGPPPARLAPHSVCSAEC